GLREYAIPCRGYGARTLSKIGTCSETENPRFVTGGLSLLRPTHVAALSRSMMSNAATQNASAVPATIRMNAIFNSWRDATETNGTRQPPRQQEIEFHAGAVF